MEDDASLIDGLLYSFNKNGFQVDAARSVTEAKKLLLEMGKYVLLILDVTLPDKSGRLECGDISIDLLACRAILNHKSLELTSAEYRLLCLLVRNAGRVVSRDVILNALWDGTGNFVDDKPAVSTGKWKNGLFSDGGALGLFFSPFN